MRRLALVCGMALVVGQTACGRRPVEFRPVASGTVGTTTVTLATDSGSLHRDPNRIQIRFTDPQGHPKPVDDPALILTFGTVEVPPVETLTQVQRMPTIQRTAVGVYQAMDALPFEGDWRVMIVWGDEGGRQRWSFTYTVP